jgi:hypothetical protein
MIVTRCKAHNRALAYTAGVYKADLNPSAHRQKARNIAQQTPVTCRVLFRDDFFDCLNMRAFSALQGRGKNPCEDET